MADRRSDVAVSFRSERGSDVHLTLYFPALVCFEDQRSEKPNHLHKVIRWHVCKYYYCNMDPVRRSEARSPITVVVPDNVVREVPIVHRIC